MIKGIKEIDITTECMVGGTSACAGCGALIGLRFILKVLGEDTIICNPASCSTLFAYHPYSPFNCSWIHTAFECMGATASGIRHSLDMQNNETTNVVVYGGDGSTFDIGLQSLNHAAYCNENIIYVCYDNGCYGNTGGQWSTATPTGASTKTRPYPNPDRPKNIEKIIAATNPNAYIATANIGFPTDLINKIEMAKETKNFSFIHIIIPCTTNWIFPASKTIEIAKLTDSCGAFPLFEVEDRVLTLNKKYENIELVDKWVKAQGRFKAMDSRDLKRLQFFVAERMDELKERNGKVFV